MDLTTQKICLYLGVAFPLVFFLGWGLIAGFLLPLPAPGDSPEDVRHFFADDTDRIRIGLIIALAAAPLQGAMAAAVSEQLRRIPGAGAFASTQMLMGGVQVLFALVPCFIWATIAFRPGAHSLDSIQFLNDFAWLFFVGGFSPPLLQSLCIGIAVLRDPGPRPVFPRWVGYFNLWCAMLFVPGGIVLLAKSGPFAWNGVLAFWIPASVFGAWFFVMFYVVRRALDERAGA